MALTNLRTDWMFGTTYAEDRDFFIKIAENRPLLVGTITTSHIHGAGDAERPTIGYGYDLVSRAWPEINAFLRGVIGTLSATQENGMDIIELFKDGDPVVIENASHVRTTRTLTNADVNSGAAGTSGSSVVVTVGGVEHLIPLDSVHSIELDEAQATPMIEWVMVRASGPSFTEKATYGTGTYFEESIASTFADSRERAALIAMSYVGGAGIIGGHLTGALASDNRAEAWYEIRYNSNNGSDRPGQAKRFAATAELFGLYDSDGPNLADAKEIFAMYAKHAVSAGDNGSSETIDQYETKFASNIAAGNTDYSLSAPNIVEGRREEFSEAFRVAFNEYRVGGGAFSDTAEVLVDFERDGNGSYDASQLLGLGGAARVLLIGEGGNDTLTGWSKGDLIIGDYFIGSDRNPSNEGNDTLAGAAGDDLLIGDGGNDVIHGGDGKDILMGDEGNDELHGDDDTEVDLLYGGEGADKFYVGEGDIVLDFDVGDQIYFNGTLITFGADLRDMIYDDALDFEAVKLTVASDNGLAIGSFETVNGGGNGLAMMADGMQVPILVMGPNTVFHHLREAEEIFVGDEPSHSGWFSRDFTNVDGSITFRGWDPSDHTPGPDPMPDLSNAHPAYDWQLSGMPGTFDPEWSLIAPPLDYATAMGFDLFSRTWNYDALLRAWSGAPALNGDDQGALETPDNTDFASLLGNPTEVGEAVAAAATAIGNASTLITPLVLDLDGNGVELTKLSDSTAYFDLDANGFAQKTGWVTGGDGLLAIDKDENGQIDDINELFGAPEPYREATTNGFDALAALDSNTDGKIDSSDDQFADLRVWIDADEDGITDEGELKTLSEVGVESISLSAVEDLSEVEGNTVSHTATFNKIGGGTGDISDVWFAHSTLDTYDNRTATVDAWITALPAMRGYGEVAGLRLAMSRDACLFKAVQDLSFWGGAHEEPVPGDILLQIENIALQWMLSGTEVADRGANIDAAHLIAMERLTGQAFDQTTGPEGPNPGPNAAAALEAAWSDLVLSIGTRILVQSVLKPAFEGVTYAWGTDSFDGTLDVEDAVAALADLAPAGSGADAYAFWKLAVAALDEVADDLSILATTYETELINALSTAGFELTLAELRDLNLRQASGLIVSPNEDVTVFGAAGDDEIRTGAGDDKLIGGTGNDYLVGQAGSDIYAIGKADGHDYVDDLDADPLAVDTLLLGAGILPEHVLVSRNGDDLVIRFAGTDTMTIVAGQLLDADHGIEELKFSGGTTWSRAFLEGLIVDGTGGDEKLTGTDDNDHLNGGAGADELTGGKGSDTYSVDDEGDLVTESADEGIDVVQSTISYELGANVEGLVLLDEAVDGKGNELDNFIIGNWGDNVLDGGEGADLLVGGGGTDTFIVDNVGDKVVGFGEVQSSVSWSLNDGGGNRLILTGSDDIDGTGTTEEDELTGNAGENVLSGGDSRDILDGGAGNDTLEGGGGNDVLDGGIGSDKMSGGEDDDEYYVDDASDEIIENAKGGLDTVFASTDFTLSANVENLTLTEVAAVNGTGNDSNNKIVGSDADNVLDGAGGKDEIYGGLGNDTIQGGDGNDTARGEDGNDVLQGGAGNDVLVGADGNDQWDGGTGIDQLDGGKGNDTYTVDDTSDGVFEGAGSGTGTDLVLSSATAYTLSANVENLTLTGSSNVNGTGNSSANVLTGNSGANALDGADGNDTLSGGAGNDALTGGKGNDTLDGGADIDTLTGGLGNDAYVVDDAADTVVEASGEGTDTVQTSVSYTLAANVEALTLTGSSNINGTGNSGANILLGNSGNNVLDGAAGNDVLEGADGSDTYRFGYGYGVDQVNDVVGGATPTDVLELLSGVAVADVNVAKSGNSLFIHLAGTNDRIEVVNYFSGSGQGIEEIHFADTTVWNRTFIDSLFLTGSAGNDTLNGDANSNWINGNGGTDKMAGGAGSDYYLVDSAGDTVTENASEGYDIVESSIAYTLGSNVEGLILSTGNINGSGNGLDNRISGSSGNNTLDGGAGNDFLNGGAGNDTYVVDSTSDQTVENSGEGTDLVQSSVNWTLAANTENLTLTGSSNLDGTGNELANTLAGNSGTNTLTGLDGDDTIDGGTGADTLVGGAGDDTYTVDNTGDTVTELDGEGTDLVKAGVTYTLSAYVDNLTLTGSSAINGTGNGLANVITGNSGANELDGAAGNDTLDGGTNADKMTGGLGDDFYFVDNASDQVIEASSEGTDTVQSTITLTLAANVENLTLSGSSNLNGTGNSLDNVLTGNTGANELSGGDGSDTLNGGTNADKMTGGLGNDTYVVDNGSDQVIEAASEGTDLVRSSITYTLGSDLENLTLTGSSAINGTGNSLDNVITGNSGTNNLQGGSGNDTLDGADGNDTLAGQGGTDLLSGGNGNDILTWDSDDSFNGGAGRDTLLYNSSGTLDVDTAKTSNIEVINLGAADDNNNGIALSLADVLDLAGTASGTGFSENGDDIDLFIYGDNTTGTRDNVDLTGGWVAAGTFSTSAITGSSTTWNLYQAADTQVAVQQGLDLTAS